MAGTYRVTFHRQTPRGWCAEFPCTRATAPRQLLALGAGPPRNRGALQLVMAGPKARREVMPAAPAVEVVVVVAATDQA